MTHLNIREVIFAVRMEKNEVVNNVKRTNSGNKTKDTSITVFKQCQFCLFLHIIMEV